MRFWRFLVVGLLLASFVNAAKLEVEKIAPSKVNVGDDISLILKVKNPFNESVVVKIVDKNIIGGSGVDIQCIEREIPAQPVTELGIEGIKANEPGKYTLEKTKLTYVNPETGEEEVVESKRVKIKVEGESSGVQMSTVQEIYQCDGINKQSTRTSSAQQMPQQQTQNKMNSAQQQTSQDMNSVKQSLQKAMQQQEQMKQEFQEQIEQNEEFKKMQEQLEGYELNKKDVAARTNNTGDFQYDYKKGEESASIKGSMENGDMKNMQMESSEQRKKMMGQLEQNPQFQKYKQQLHKQGYNQTSEPQVEQLSDNRTRMNMQFANSKNQTAQIVAEFNNGNVTKVKLETEEAKSYFWYYIIVLFVLAGYYFYIQKNKKKLVHHTIAKKEKPFDYKGHCLGLLDEAVKLFELGEKKDAYVKASRAIRVYFEYVYDKRHELTSYETLKLLHEKKYKGLRTVRDCFSLCDLVKFAKYRANKKDFDEIIKLGKRIITSLS